MREIKFRAWDGSRILYAMGIFDGKAVDGDGAESIWLWHEPAEAIMQYTGLKDKHGKELYEGDIVEDKFILTIFEPHEKRTEKPFEVKVPDVYYQKEFHGYDFEEDFEIIGNVHENPELIKEEL